MKHIFRMIFFMLCAAPLTASAQEPEMADAMRSEGKIYVLLAIILVVLFGLITYLVFIDRKVTRIEKKLPGNKH